MAFNQIVMDQQIRKNFPDAKIGWLLADISVQESHPYAETLKSGLVQMLQAKGITQESLTQQYEVAQWREIFRGMGVKPQKYRSTVEALVKRVLKDQNMWSISSVVDMYNCVTVSTFLALGAFDTAHIDGDIVLRYGQEDEKFLPLGSDEEIIPVDPRQIVYADDTKIISWLWCYRDTRLTGITLDTKEAVFIVDTAFSPKMSSVQNGIDMLSKHLIQMGCQPKDSGIVG